MNESELINTNKLQGERGREGERERERGRGGFKIFI